MRAIASSTACSGLMPSAATRWIALRPDVLVIDLAVPQIARSCGVIVSQRPRGGLHRCGHAMRVAGVEPERAVEERRNRRQHALAGKVEIVHEPAIGHEEVDELLGGGDVAPVFEDHGLRVAPFDRKGPARGIRRPFDRGGVLEVVVGPLGLERVRDRERLVRRHDDRLGEERLVVAAVVPAHRIGRGAALAIDGRIVVDRLDQSPPDLRIVDDQLALVGHVVRIVGMDELEELVCGVVGLDRHGQADTPDVVAARGLAHRRLHPVAPERPERLPLLGNVVEREARLLQEGSSRRGRYP